MSEGKQAAGGLLGGIGELQTIPGMPVHEARGRHELAGVHGALAGESFIRFGAPVEGIAKHQREGWKQSELLGSGR